ncbi:MAG: hypothetical protein K8R40_06015 [Anaerolineaceae bacterium]|nr:hypothetical protein [Anaerolineaceae bacterium]
MKNNVARLLESKNINFDLIELGTHDKLSAVKVACLLEVKPEIVYKTIVLKPKGIPILVLLQSDAAVDTKKVASFLGEKKIKVVSHKDAELLTGLQTGGISPLALLHKNFQVVIDNNVENLSKIIISAGQRGFQIRISPADFISLTKAKIAPICL